MLKVYIFKRGNIYRHNLDILTVTSFSDLILLSLVAKALSHCHQNICHQNRSSLVNSIINPTKRNEEKQSACHY